MMLWERKGQELIEVARHRVDREERLEEWIEKDVRILGLDLLIIGRQVQSPFRGRIDLIALDSRGAVVVIELKRDRSPRDVVAQVLDYASWVRTLTTRDVLDISDKYKKLPEGLARAFFNRFNTELPEDLNTSHRMVIVASELDDASERIVQYLSSAHSLNINVVFFNCFAREGIELLGRSWLMDPQEVEERSEGRGKGLWEGYWFVNLGEGDHRCWDDCRKYGFISAGQGQVYSEPLKRLKVGDKIFGYLKRTGYLGYGVVESESQMARDFIPAGSDEHLFNLPLKQEGIKANADNPEMCEWVVGVKWLKTYSHADAQTYKGIFANQNIVCKLRDAATLGFLKKQFDVEE